MASLNDSFEYNTTLKYFSSALLRTWWTSLYFNRLRDYDEDQNGGSLAAELEHFRFLNL